MITGSPPNLVVLNVLDRQYGEGVSPLTYARYSLQCTVYSIQCTVYCVQFSVYSVDLTVYSAHLLVNLQLQLRMTYWNTYDYKEHKDNQM